MKIQTQNYFYEDDNGIPLFSIKLFIIPDFPEIIFDCSLNLNFSDHPEIKKVVRKICLKNLPQEKRNSLLQEFYLLVNKIDRVQERFARINLPCENDPDYHSIENGRELIFEHQFADYTPFSQYMHSSAFDVLKRNLRPFKSWKSTRELDRKVFEEELKKGCELQQAYVDVYSKSAKFYSTKLEIVDDVYEFYLMETSKIMFVFFCTT